MFNFVIFVNYCCMVTPKKISYAHRRLKKDYTLTRIMLFGTFDLLHEGHRSFFRQARGLASHPHLIVSVARDKNVEKIKGRKPLYTERQRLEFVRRTGLVDRAVLGALGDHIPHIKRQRPDIIALGYDQRGEYVSNLKTSLLQAGIHAHIVRLKPHYPEKFKSSRLKSSAL